MKTQMLTPGETYPFRIVKTTSLSDNEHYVVLESPFLSRHLLNRSDYHGFQFKRGEFLSCRIDKINCSGKIFLEPENPNYHEGEFYKFLFSHKEVVINSLGEPQSVTVLKGRKGERVIMPLSGNEVYAKNGDFIAGCLVRIKKGILILHKEKDLYDKYKYNNIYSFRLTREGINHKRNPVYIFSDKEGNEFSVQKDNYKYYGLNTGDEVKCKITGCNFDGRFIIEPAHPYLQDGNVYPFKWLRKEPFYKHSGEVHETHIVVDFKGNEQVAAPVNDALLNAFKTPIENYFIERIHKGKLVLSPQL